MSKKPQIPLSYLQKWLQQAIIGPSGAEARPAKAFLPKEYQELNLDVLIKPSKRMSSRQHLGIYQHSYIARLRVCMANQFKALEHALGEELFKGFADQYLQQYPSQSYTLTDLGAQFADYLEATRPDKEQAKKEDWPDFMIELSRFEYWINILLDIHEEVYELADQSTPEEQLQLIPVFEVFEFQFPIRWYYSEFIKDRNPELPFPEKTYCFILRKNLRLAFFDLNEKQFHFLNVLKQTGSVAAARDSMIEAQKMDIETFNEMWKTWKVQWIRLGVFQDLITAENK